MVVMESVKEG